MPISRRLPKKISFEDLVISNDKKQQILEIISFLNDREKVFSKWGFDKKNNTINGVNLLFAGESVNGKAMIADIIADKLKLNLYKINLSSLVGKYIGETEKT